MVVTEVSLVITTDQIGIPVGRNEKMIARGITLYMPNIMKIVIMVQYVVSCAVIVKELAGIGDK